MKYATVCSGIEAPSVAWDSLGWEPQWFSQFDPEHDYTRRPDFPSQVLTHHYPEVANLGDMTKIHETEIYSRSAFDVLCGGTPCQSFSVAGLRKGLADPRGNLMLTFLALADRKRPRWVVWENVPGVLSSNGGRDFGTFLGGLAELGYGWAYRVLDAQYYGVAQRRRRVFVVGCFGDYRRAGAVLFERHSLQGHPAPGRKTREEVAPTIRSGSANGSPSHGQWSGDSRDELIVPVRQYCQDVAPTLNAHFGEKMGLENQRINGGGGLFVVSGGQANATIDTAVAPTLNLNKDHPYVVSSLTTRPYADNESNESKLVPVTFGIDEECNVTNNGFGPLLRGGQGGTRQAVAYADTAPTICASGPPYSRMGNDRVETEALAVKGMAVRRLTPTECERLQGFPDGYTDIKPGNKPTPDGVRYKALGNSMAVPVMRWLGQRIQLVNDLTNTT